MLNSRHDRHTLSYIAITPLTTPITRADGTTQSVTAVCFPHRTLDERYSVILLATDQLPLLDQLKTYQDIDQLPVLASMVAYPQAPKDYRYHEEEPHACINMDDIEKVDATVVNAEAVLVEYAFRLSRELGLGGHVGVLSSSVKKEDVLKADRLTFYATGLRSIFSAHDSEIEMLNLYKKWQIENPAPSTYEAHTIVSELNLHKIVREEGLYSSEMFLPHYTVQSLQTKFPEIATRMIEVNVINNFTRVLNSALYRLRNTERLQTVIQNKISDLRAYEFEEILAWVFGDTAGYKATLNYSDTWVVGQMGGRIANALFSERFLAAMADQVKDASYRPMNHVALYSMYHWAMQEDKVAFAAIIRNKLNLNLIPVNSVLNTATSVLEDKEVNQDKIGLMLEVVQSVVAKPVSTTESNKTNNATDLEALKGYQFLLQVLLTPDNVPAMPAINAGRDVYLNSLRNALGVAVKLRSDTICLAFISAVAMLPYFGNDKPEDKVIDQAIIDIARLGDRDKLTQLFAYIENKKIIIDVGTYANAFFAATYNKKLESIKTLVAACPNTRMIPGYLTGVHFLVQSDRSPVEKEIVDFFAETYQGYVQKWTHCIDAFIAMLGNDSNFPNRQSIFQHAHAKFKKTLIDELFKISTCLNGDSLQSYYIGSVAEKIAGVFVNFQSSVSNDRDKTYLTSLQTFFSCDEQGAMPATFIQNKLNEIVFASTKKARKTNVAAPVNDQSVEVVKSDLSTGFKLSS